MKKSRMFLASSAFILAIAGAVVSRASADRSFTTFYTKVSGSCNITTTCVPTTQVPDCTYYTALGGQNCGHPFNGKRIQ